MASYPPPGTVACYKVGVLAPVGSSASTATGYSSSGSTMASDNRTKCSENPYYQYKNDLPYHVCQALSNGSDDCASTTCSDSASVQWQVAAARANEAQRKAGAKQTTEVVGATRRHWILPPPAPVSCRSEGETEHAAANEEPLHPMPKSSVGPTQLLKIKPHGSKVGRHWMLDPPKNPDQEKDSAAHNASQVGMKAQSEIAEEEACIGTWSYPNSSYTIKRLDGELVFQHKIPGGGSICGRLHWRGQWLEAEVYDAQDEHVGAIRLRPATDPRTITSNFRAAPKFSGDTDDGVGALAAAKADWGPDVLATKEEFGCKHAVQSATGCSPEPPLSDSIGVCFTSAAWGFADASPCSTAATVPGRVSLEAPVKHTFIHFDEPKQYTLPKSSPAILSNGPFMVRSVKMQQAHSSGNCRPCAYFWGKEDGCRGGNSCKFCHLCLPGELKRRRREKDRLLRAQQRAARTSPAVTMG